MGIFVAELALSFVVSLPGSLEGGDEVRLKATELLPLGVLNRVTID